jgi:hypothetical protein
VTSILGGADFGMWLPLILGGAALQRCNNGTVEIEALAAEVVDVCSPQR